MTYVFHVAFDAGLCSQNKREHWTAHQRVKKAARAAAFRAWIDAGSPRTQARCRVSAVIRRHRRLDPLNLAGCLKPIWDGCLCGRHLGRRLLPALLPDDSEEWVEVGEISQEVIKRTEEPTVVVTVEELTADADGRRP